MKYTVKDLRKVSKDYKSNFKKLEKACYSGDKKEHLRCLTEENRLNILQVRIQKYFHVYIPDPCPIKHSIACEACTGCYKRNDPIVNKRQKNHKRSNRMVNPNRLAVGSEYWDCSLHPRNYPTMRMNTRRVKKEKAA